MVKRNRRKNQKGLGFYLFIALLIFFVVFFFPYPLSKTTATRNNPTSIDRLESTYCSKLISYQCFPTKLCYLWFDPNNIYNDIPEYIDSYIGLESKYVNEPIKRCAKTTLTESQLKQRLGSEVCVDKWYDPPPVCPGFDCYTTDYYYCAR